MINYTKDATEILDIPVRFRNLGTVTASHPTSPLLDTITPSGLTIAVTMAADGKSAALLVSGGSNPNTYDCKIYFNLSNGGRRRAEFTVTMTP